MKLSDYERYLSHEQECYDADLDLENELYNRFNYSQRDIEDAIDRATEAYEDRRMSE